ncbi:unnamed protein product, partial [Prorocentrum cordatum]
AFLGGQTAQAHLLLEAAEQHGGPDICMAETLHRLGAEGVTANKKMFFSLDQNGAVAWLASVKRHEPATAVRAHSIMTSVFNVKQFLGTLAESETQHSERQRDVRLYEAAAGE